MINEQGGMNGRKIKLISLDDGYSPPKTVEQTRKLVEQDEVAFIFSPLGTPTNTAIQQYLNEQQGAAALRRHRRDANGAIPSISLDDGLAAELPRPRRASTRATSSKHKPDAKIAHALSER